VAAPCADRIRPVTDGQTVQVGPLTARAFHLPGHTEGSTAWLVNGVLYFGDAADATLEGDLVGPKWVFSDDVPRAEASLRALARRLVDEGVEVRGLAFAHTGTLDGDAALRAHAAR
jgi:glyoxylase-like metal-dependent hydrolase (beta-lactamase superfamily II)